MHDFGCTRLHAASLDNRARHDRRLGVQTLSPDPWLQGAGQEGNLWPNGDKISGTNWWCIITGYVHKLWLRHCCSAADRGAVFSSWRQVSHFEWSRGLLSQFNLGQPGNWSPASKGSQIINGELKTHAITLNLCNDVNRFVALVILVGADLWHWEAKQRSENKWAIGQNSCSERLDQRRHINNVAKLHLQKQSGGKYLVKVKS